MKARGLRAIPLLVAGAACLNWASTATAEDCGSPCTVTRAGLPTLRLVNSIEGVPDWDLETSAFGVELAPRSDLGNHGAFRVEHGARSNTLVIDAHGRVGIGTTVPTASLDIWSSGPRIQLNDTSALGESMQLWQVEDVFILNSGARNIVRISTGAPNRSLVVADDGDVGIGRGLEVKGDAIVRGDVSLGSSRALKTAFDAVDPAEVLAKLVDLPVASWRYTTEDASTRHIGPFAEDFHRLFGLGDAETISMVDAQGVAFAAIQRLAQRLADKENELASLRSDKDAQLAELLARLTTVEQRLDPGAPFDCRRASGGLR